MRTSANQLGDVLFGKAKRVILSQLFGRPKDRFFVRELARLANVTPSTLSRDLSALTKVGLIRRTEEGRQVYYQANDDSPIFSELRSLVTKTFGVIEVLRTMLEPVNPRIHLALVYGSVASGEYDSRSDIDLLVVGDVRLSEYSKRLLEAERKLSRKISPTHFSVEEFYRVSKGPGFIKTILGRPVLLFIGLRNDLERARQS